MPTTMLRSTIFLAFEARARRTIRSWKPTVVVGAASRTFNIGSFSIAAFLAVNEASHMSHDENVPDYPDEKIPDLEIATLPSFWGEAPRY